MTAATYAQAVIDAARMQIAEYIERARSLNEQGHTQAAFVWTVAADQVRDKITDLEAIMRMVESERQSMLNVAHTLDNLARKASREADEAREMGDWDGAARNTGMVIGFKSGVEAVEGAAS